MTSLEEAVLFLLEHTNFGIAPEPNARAKYLAARVRYITGQSEDKPEMPALEWLGEPTPKKKGKKA